MSTKTGYPASDPLFRHNPDSYEIQQLCNEYDLGTLMHKHGDLGGAFNVNLKVETTKGSYVIRIAFGLTTAQNLAFSQRVITVLDEAKVPVLMPLKNQLGTIWSKYKDRYVIVTPYIDALPFDSSIDHANASGRMLRRIHDSLSPIEPGPVPSWSNYPSGDVLSEGAALLRDICDISKNQLFKVERLYKRVMSDWNPELILPSTIIHGDWHTGNLLYNANNEVEVVMDFDFAQRAERIHDLAYMLWALLRHLPQLHLAKAFLNGYGNISEMERELLPQATARASLFFVCTSSFTPHPKQELDRQLNEQEPFIDWVLSDDGRCSLSRQIL